MTWTAVPKGAGFGFFQEDKEMRKTGKTYEAIGQNNSYLLFNYKIQYPTVWNELKTTYLN